MLNFVPYQQVTVLVNTALRHKDYNQPYWDKKTEPRTGEITVLRDTGSANFICSGGASHDKPSEYYKSESIDYETDVNELNIARLLSMNNLPTLVYSTKIIFPNDEDTKYSFAGCTDLFDYLCQPAHLHLKETISEELYAMTEREESRYIQPEIFSLAELKALEQNIRVHPDFKETIQSEILNRLAKTNNILSEEEKIFVTRMLNTPKASIKIKVEHLRSFSDDELRDRLPPPDHNTYHLVSDTIMETLQNKSLADLKRLETREAQNPNYNNLVLEVISIKLSMQSNYTSVDKAYISQWLNNPEKQRHITQKLLSLFKLTELYAVLPANEDIPILNSRRTYPWAIETNASFAQTLEREIFACLQTKDPQTFDAQDKTFIKRLLNRSRCIHDLQRFHLTNFTDDELFSLLKPESKTKNNILVTEEISLRLAAKPLEALRNLNPGPGSWLKKQIDKMILALLAKQETSYTEKDNTFISEMLQLDEMLPEILFCHLSGQNQINIRKYSNFLANGNSTKKTGFGKWVFNHYEKKETLENDEQQLAFELLNTRTIGNDQLPLLKKLDKPFITRLYGNCGSKDEKSFFHANFPETKPNTQPRILSEQEKNKLATQLLERRLPRIPKVLSPMFYEQHELVTRKRVIVDAYGSSRAVKQSKVYNTKHQAKYNKILNPGKIPDYASDEERDNSTQNNPPPELR